MAKRDDTVLATCDVIDTPASINMHRMTAVITTRSASTRSTDCGNWCGRRLVVDQRTSQDSNIYKGAVYRLEGLVKKYDLRRREGSRKWEYIILKRNRVPDRNTWKLFSFTWLIGTSVLGLGKRLCRWLKNVKCDRILKDETVIINWVELIRWWMCDKWRSERNFLKIWVSGAWEHRMPNNVELTVEVAVTDAIEEWVCIVKTVRVKLPCHLAY